MFRRRWRGDRNKMKAVFRLQFNASQIPQPGWNALVVSLVPLDSGKPTAKSEKAVVLDGACCWEKAIFETVKLSKEPRTGRIGDKVYRFVLSTTDSPKDAILGEASFDLASYAEVVKPFLVSLPLRASNCNPVLHLTIQRVHDHVDGRESEENEISQKKRISQSQLSNHGTKDSISSTEEHTQLNSQVSLKFPSNSSVAFQIESNGSLVKSGSFDALAVSESDNGLEQYTPLQNGFKDSNNFLSPLRDNGSSQTASANSKNSIEEFRDHRRSTTECSVASAPDASSDGSTNSSEDTGLRERMQRPDMSSEQLREKIAVLARQVEVSELELQALRKLVVKEKRQGEDLTKELCLLRDERNALRRKCELLKASELNIGIERVHSLRLDGEDLKLQLEEMKQELKHEKNLNASLHLQLQKTHESNDELILAVKDLEELLEQKNRELPCSYCKQISVKSADDDNSLPNICTSVNDLSSERQREGSKDLPETFSERKDDELEVLAKENDDVQVEYSLEQKIVELTEEIESYKKDRDNVEMQMEQLALDFEIIKQENHDLSSKLEQSQLREQLKMQYECSAHSSIISDLEAHVENLEKELEQQAEIYEAYLTRVVTGKIEQEQRAIHAEEALRRCKQNNASTAERLQEEFRRLSTQMSTVFNANEKLAKQAMVEASELRLQKNNLEDSLEKANEELAAIKYQYKIQIRDLLRQINLKIEDANELQVKLKNNREELENQKKSEEAMRKDLTEEISTLKVAIEVLSQENSKLYDQIKEKQNLMAVFKQERSRGKCEVDAQLACMRIQADESKEEINNLKQLKDEEEIAIRSLTSEIEELRKQCSILNKSLVEDVVEKEGLKSQVLHLKGDLQKKEEIITLLENKLKDNKNLRATLSDGGAKAVQRNKSKSSPSVHGSKELAHLHEKVQSLQEDLKFKEDEMENLIHTFSENEKNLSSRIEELENGSHHLQYREETTSVCHGNGASDNLIIRNGTPDPKTEECLTNNSNHQIDLDASSQEVSLLKEKNESMGIELKEMQQKYFELSLRFAEVEGERQQLVMRVRSLKNAKRS